jgi:hypothetical protein
LDVTEERQFRNRGLSHIEDCAFEFIIRLEEIRVNNINEAKLAKHKELIVEKALDHTKSDEQVWLLWQMCFPHEIKNVKQVNMQTL